MQIKSLRVKSYRSWQVDDRAYSSEVQKRYKTLESYKKLKANGGSEAIILEVLGISRSTLYRLKRRYTAQGLPGLEALSKKPHRVRTPQWDKKHMALVLKLRQQEPTWGKSKIHRVLVREHGVTLSVTTVGRILSRLLALGQIKTAYFAAQKNKPKRRRVFQKHANRWKFEMKGTVPGEMIQIDHMSVYSNSACVKHFKAVCPVSRFMVCEVYRNATSKTAAEFLEKVRKEMPFKIHSLQVDGGSEFMKDFEELCQTYDIPLFVLPPRSPKYNGKVERCNGVTRDDFYSQYQDVFDVSTLRPHLQHYQKKYNSYRPHQALHNLTPMEYLMTNQNRAA